MDAFRPYDLDSARIRPRFAHAIWDVAHHPDLTHHRANKVVPRWYLESCFVIDLLGGAALILAPTL